MAKRPLVNHVTMTTPRLLQPQPAFVREAIKRTAVRSFPPPGYRELNIDGGGRPENIVVHLKRDVIEEDLWKQNQLLGSPARRGGTSGFCGPASRRHVSRRSRSPGPAPGSLIALSPRRSALGGRFGTQSGIFS
ncbi:hypothetical protein EYF80_047463 [Liparis tanakae]|uniref:Uncharacterized protein n=1 Tax=Liparis tanakae TaxID=230148 RepID=A0A4Z2FMK4_9TELE|nr:hypothetical protein EYF80_047463 [Liparis tanakae]